MTFRFIHTADWQIGKPFANLPSDLAGELFAARLSVIPRIAAIARQQGVDHVLVAGDVFDSERLETSVLRRTLEFLKREATVTWLLLPGNHDPARADGIWDRVAAIGLPANVAMLNAEQPYGVSAQAVIFPAPLRSRAPGHDPTEWFACAPSEPGQARVGLAHGSITGFSTEGESALLIAPDRAARSRLDYLALGDWHGVTSIDARTWYSGTPEPDRYPSNAPGYVLAVTVEAGGIPRVEQVACGQFTWARHEASLSSADDIWALSRAIESLVPSPAHTLLKVKLTGSLTLADQAALTAWREETSGRVRHLEVDSEALIIRAAAADLDQFGADGALRATAEKLSRGAEADPVAQRAVQRLYAYVCEARRGAT